MKIRPEDKESVSIAEPCRELYAHDSKIIAVTPFHNNSSLQEGRYAFEDAAASLYFWGASATYSSVAEELTPRLSEYAQSAVEAALAATGGAQVVSRAQLDQLLNEQTFQMTLADPDTVMELGQLVGAEYIVTGSVNKINFRYRSGLETDYDTSNWVGIALQLGSSLLNAFSAGWYVDTLLSVNIIDVRTGQIIASHSSEGTAFLGDSSFSATRALGGAQTAMNSGMVQTIEFMNNAFKMNVYVNEVRGGGKMLLINRGSSYGISTGDIFSLQEMHIRTDFFSGTSTCAAMDSDNLYIATEYIGDDYAWLEIDSGDKKARLGSLLRRVSVREE